MKISTFGSLRLFGLGLAALAFVQTDASAQFDVTVNTIEVTQAMQTGTTPLTGERSTFVRVTTNLVNPPSDPVDLDGIMRVFDGGVEVPESPIFSRNGPYPATPSPNLNVQKGTLNFVCLPPISNDVVFTIEINPAGPNFVAESNTANNTASTVSFIFRQRAITEFAYSPIDYRPGGGGTPNVPNPVLIEPGSGDNFIMGIYPARDFNYHRTDAPSKLWTSSLNGSGSALLNSLAVDVSLMNPRPDFLYGWVPGGLPYNGQSFLNSPVSMGNTQTFKFQRTYAHEVGHNTGLSHVNLLISDRGVDVEHHLNITEGLGVIKKTILNDIMVPGLNTDQAWVHDTHYKHFYNHPKIANPAPVSLSPTPLMFTGIWNTQTGATTLTHVLNLPQSGELTPAVPAERADFLVTTYAGGDLVQELPITAASTTDSCADVDPDSADSSQPLTEIAFTAVLPQQGAPIDRLVVEPMNGVEANSVTLDRTPNAPQVQFTFPAANGDVSAGQVTVAWDGTDADGDELTYYLRYSQDGFRFAPLATGITETHWNVDLAELGRVVDGSAFFQVIATDGLNTTVANSPVLFGGGAIHAQGGNDPWVFIVTPDDGKSYVRGSTVILHSSSWDIEDNAIFGASISWSSDLDGAIGTGRTLGVADLSVGTHVITVTATDSNLQTSTDTATVTITARGLPGEGPVVNYCTPGTSASGCQAVLSSVGTPSATASSGFTLTASPLEGDKDGLFFFGSNGQQANPWGSGTSFQCVTPPVKRGGLLVGIGTPGTCDGSTSQDLNALWCPACPKAAKNPGAGTVTQAQFWYRDPFNTSNQTTSLSDAVEFTVQP